VLARGRTPWNTNGPSLGNHPTSIHRLPAEDRRTDVPRRQRGARPCAVVDQSLTTGSVKGRLNSNDARLMGRLNSMRKAIQLTRQRVAAEQRTSCAQPADERAAYKGWIVRIGDREWVLRALLTRTKDPMVANTLLACLLATRLGFVTVCGTKHRVAGGRVPRHLLFRNVNACHAGDPTYCSVVTQVFT
jgi:hypothetical protein